MLRELLNIVEEKYSHWLSVGDGLVYSLLGIAVVFFGLVLLMLVIKIMGAVKKKDAPEAAAAPALASVPTAPGSAGELKLYDTPERDAAMVMAIVADRLGKPVNEIRFVSIREVK